jgi:hypothetical protein
MTGSPSDRERIHYRYATRREQLVELWTDFLANRPLQLALAAILFVLVTLRILTPETVGFASLQAGQCLFVRTSAANALIADRPIGEDDEVRATLRSQGAEIASCDLSHSHEVAGAGDLPDGPDVEYPGGAALVERETPACEAAFEAHVGRTIDESTYEPLVVVPDTGDWREGDRSYACLVQRADGRFMDHRAAGSGE